MMLCRAELYTIIISCITTLLLAQKLFLEKQFDMSAVYKNLIYRFFVKLTCF